MRTTLLNSILLIFSLFLVLSGSSRAAITGVWALGESEKVFREDDNHPDRYGNSIWDGTTIRMRGLYNEILAFQIIVETDASGAIGVNLHIDPPKHIESGEVIGAAGSQKYGTDGTLELFSEHYVRVDTPSWYLPNSAPEHATGWIPDALIPPEALPGRGGLPIDIGAADPPAESRNQGFWIDLCLPRNRSFPAGVYSGKVRVMEGTREVAALPLEVTLLPYALSEEDLSISWAFAHLLSIRDFFPDLTFAELERQFKFLARRHRIELAGGSEQNWGPFDIYEMTDYLPYLTGSAYTPAKGYRGPGEGRGDRLFPIGMYGAQFRSTYNPDALGASRDWAWVQSDLWVNWFTIHAPQVRYFWYMVDEPGESLFPLIAERAGWIHSNPGPGAKLPIFVTWEYSPTLANDIDIWATGAFLNIPTMLDLQRQGRDYWFYNGRRPQTGSVSMDAPAADIRMNAWARYLYEVNVWFQWEISWWVHDESGTIVHHRPFTDPLPTSFPVNGDGCFVYPGRNPFYADEDRGLNQIFPSIRLKNIRRGQQDHALMSLVEQKAGRDTVMIMVNNIVGSAFDYVSDMDTVHWSQRGEDYDRVRNQLLNLLIKSDEPTGVAESGRGAAIPTMSFLYQNYPNPFNPATTIEYELKESGDITLEIYNTLGQRVRVLAGKTQPAGAYSLIWDGRNDSGILVPSGVYLYRLSAGKFLQTKKMIFMK